MSNPKEDFLIHVHNHPYFSIFLKDLETKRPVVPAHNPDEDNTEKWKSSSAQQKGFDYCCSLFNIKME